MLTRPAAVAFVFYPGDPLELAQCVDALLAAVPETNRPAPKLLIAPHAGYPYSGNIAAAAYARLASRRGQIRRVVLLGPTHRVAVRGLALPESTGFATPLGTVPLDLAACAALDRLPQIVRSERAHAQEHSLEVQLPFLQRTLGEFALVPLAVGQASAEAVAEVVELLWGGPETLIVVSSDLSHFHPYAEAQRIDEASCRAILAGRPQLHPEQACGAYPLNGALLAASRRGLRPQLIAYCNSGDTAGDRQRVVGYASFALNEDGEGAHD